MLFPDNPNARRGNELCSADRQQVLGSYVNRFTRQHRPAWSRKPWKDGQSYPVQFDSDADWLANTWFAVRKDGRLDQRHAACWSQPTWPDHPELRKTAA